MKFIYKNSLLGETVIQDTLKQLSPYRTHLEDVAKTNNYDSDEASINLPFDEFLFNKITELKNKKVTDQLKYIVVIGIGGSNLGTKAIYDGLYGFYDTLEPNRFPKMIFLDTQDPDVLYKTTELINTLGSKEEILVNTISKSGGTTETAANIEVVYEALSKKFGEVNDRFVITTDEGSKMQEIAQTLHIDVLNIPKKVGGRFSVFSAVGLCPLAAMNFDISIIQEAAKKERDAALKENSNAMISAAILYLQYKNGKNINDNFIFLPQLESMGKWYRQLQGESIGKNGKGITPTVSVGSTDLHSVGQLYLGGPKDKITNFIYGESSKEHTTVPANTNFNLVDAVKGKSIHKIMNAIVEGTKIAYQKQELPYMEIVLDTVSVSSIAKFMQFKMMEMMYLGKLMEVNTFDQPHVELYKVETKKLLTE